MVLASPNTVALSLGLVALLTAGCSGSIAPPSGDAGAPDGGARSDGGAGDDSTGDDGGPAADSGITGQDGGSTVDAGAACSASGDCAAGHTCVFKIADGCSAKGVCVTPTKGPTCALVQLACSCANQSVNVACTPYPNGYASAPIAFAQECELSVPDAARGGLTCGTMQCPAGDVCKVGMGGAYPGTTNYSCVAVPPSCAANATCDCVKSALSATSCSSSPEGLTVTFDYP